MVKDVYKCLLSAKFIISNQFLNEYDAALKNIKAIFKDMADIKKLADPRSFGPGAWLVIHTLAYNAQSNSEKTHFQRSMKHICEGLKCSVCSGHCGDYLKNHPIRDYWYVKDKEGRDVGMFKWSWAFHNAVNARLGKPILDYSTAYYLYSDSEDTVCTKENCESDEETPPPSFPKPSPSSYPKSTRTYLSRKNGLITFPNPKTNIRGYRRRN